MSWMCGGSRCGSVADGGEVFVDPVADHQASAGGDGDGVGASVWVVGRVAVEVRGDLQYRSTDTTEPSPRTRHSPSGAG